MVGNLVESGAEMSADIASIPSWKTALLERRRLHDKELIVCHTPSSGASSASQLPAVGDSAVPAWKRDILSRKQKQRNSFVFLAKHGQTTDDIQPDDTNLNNNNGHVGSVLCYEPPAHMSATVEDETQLVEERLLPIHQNPILRLDLKKRCQSSSGSSRSSVSHVTTSSTGSHGRASALLSESYQDNNVTEDVFNSEDDDHEPEVAYGKGFVHKLLMKFSHLSTSSSVDQTPKNRYLKQRFSSLVETPKVYGAEPRRKLSDDLDSVPTKPPMAKFHSVDDLRHEVKFPLTVSHSESMNGLDITATTDINGDIGSCPDHADSDEKQDCVLLANAGVSEDLPFVNIVSNARSLFESLAVHSATQKQPVSPLGSQMTASGRFSYISKLEQSQQGKSAKQSCVLQDVSCAKVSHDGVEELVKSSTEVSQSDSVDVCRNVDAEVDSDGNKAIQESDSQVINSMPSPTSICSPGRNVTTSSTSSSSWQPATDAGDLSSSDVDIRHLKCSSLKVYEEEHADMPAAVITSSTADNSHLSTIDTKSSSTAEHVSTDIVKPVNEDHCTVDNKDIVKTAPITSSIGKKVAPSRPGKLVIRPASNLVAAKTSSEYLELTKFNDVRKGEFAPPLKKERMNAVWCDDDDDADKVDALTSNVINAEQYVFTGAGLVIGRSLLTKTNRKKSIIFDDSLTETFEYPSEQSLMASTPAQPGDLDYEPDQLIHSSALLVTPSIVAAGVLSSYQSRTQVDYQLGMKQNTSYTDTDRSSTAPASSAAAAAASVAETSSSWSKNTSSDLLF